MNSSLPVWTFKNQIRYIRMEIRKENRGGKRPGAGRKKMNPDEMRVQMVITISPAIKDRIKTISKQLGISPGRYIEQVINSSDNEG